MIDARHLYLSACNERGYFGNTNFAAHIDSPRNKKCYVAFIFILRSVRDIGGNDFPGDTLRDTIRSFGGIGIVDGNFGGMVRSKFISRCGIMLRRRLCQ